MKPLKNRFSIIFSALVAATLATTMIAAPAFATESRAVVEYDRFKWTEEEPHTSTTLDSDFKFLNYSVDIDVTYSWEEDFEWVYVKKGKDGAWLKGNSPESAFDFFKNISNYGTQKAKSLAELEDNAWADYANGIKGGTDLKAKNRYRTFFLCYNIYLKNHAEKELYVSFEEQGINVDSTEFDGVSYSSTSYAEKGYLDYRTMVPWSRNVYEDNFDSGGLWWTSQYADMNRYKTNTSYTSLITESIVVGNNSKYATTSSRKMPNNEYVVGISPKSDFTPKKGSAWIAENIAEEAGIINAQIKLIFTKKD